MTLKGGSECDFTMLQCAWEKVTKDRDRYYDLERREEEFSLRREIRILSGINIFITMQNLLSWQIHSPHILFKGFIWLPGGIFNVFL